LVIALVVVIFCGTDSNNANGKKAIYLIKGENQNWSPRVDCERGNGYPVVFYGDYYGISGQNLIPGQKDEKGQGTFKTNATSVSVYVQEGK
jgi:hypothetical protein